MNIAQPSDILELASTTSSSGSDDVRSMAGESNDKTVNMGASSTRPRIRFCDRKPAHWHQPRKFAATYPTILRSAPTKTRSGSRGPSPLGDPSRSVTASQLLQESMAETGGIFHAW